MANICSGAFPFLGRSGGGGAGQATVANLFASGQTREGLQIAYLGEGAGANWALAVERRDASQISVTIDEDTRLVWLFYNEGDTIEEVFEALESIEDLDATVIAGTDMNAVVEPHFVTPRPFLSGEPYGQYTEAHFPAVALFEHPTPATALFEAVDGGAAGLSVQLGEPLEYGLEPNDWSIIGMQRYQGTADIPQQNPTLVESDFSSSTTDLQDYLGVFANDAAAQASSDYDLTRSQLYWRTQDRRTRHHNANNADWLSSPNQANERARLGAYMLSFPYVPGNNGVITDYSYANAAAAVAHILANNFAAGVNNDNSRYSFDRTYVYYNQAEAKLKVITDLTPAEGPTAATVDMPTSATGGLRITATPAGTAGNDFYTRATASNVTGVSYNAPVKEFNVIVNNNANAQAVRDAFNSDADNQGFSMAYYGTEDGTTVVSSGNVLVAGFGTRRQFSGGSAGVYVVDAVDGEPADPIHIILLPDNRDETTLDQERFPRVTTGTHAYVGEHANDAAATAALAGATNAVYYDTSVGIGFVLRFTSDGGATWANVVENDDLFDLIGARTLDYDIPSQSWQANGLVSDAVVDRADTAEVLAVLPSVSTFIDRTLYHVYFNEDLDYLVRIKPDLYPLRPNIEIYYNRAAGGALDGPDTLDDIRDYINTHFEGLSADYTGGADANTQVTRPFANRSQFSGGALSGLKVLLGSEIALGAAGNDYRFKARERFAGGAAQAETQATLRIYTDISRNRGVLITLEAGITDVQSEDVSSGQFGNDWVFRVLSPTDQFQGQVSLNTALREINYYAHTAAEGEQDTAVQLLNACNAGGTGVSAAYFGAGNAGTELIFAGSLGRINEGQRDFTGGLDAHAGGGEDPISVAIGPSNAKVRIPVFGGAGGVEIELTDPAGAAGDGWVAVGENLEGPASVTRNDDDRELVMRGDGSITVDSLLNHLQDISGMVGRVYGAASGNENIGFPLRREFLGGLDGTDIEIYYAPVAKGNIATPDTMGDVKAVIDATEGLSSHYYNGATAATTAIRHVPWEHEFEGGDTQDFDLGSFALGPATNTFTGNTRADAEAARDAYAAANPAWVVAYRGNASLWIALRWGNAGAQVGQTLRAEAQNPPVAGDWVEQNLALVGQKGDKGDRGIPGTGAGAATLLDLSVANATAANVVEGSAVVFQSVTGDFLIVTEPTDTAPRIRLELPAGRTLIGVYDGGVDITVDFTRQGATQVWLSNVDYNGGALALLVRTGT